MIRSGSYSTFCPTSATKFQKETDVSGAFGQLFSRVENPLREIVTQLSEIGIEVVEAQKDLTIRRCLVKMDVINDLIKRCKRLEGQLGSQAALLDSMQMDMQQIWQEQLDRVRRQQILYREKIQECSAYRNTARNALTAAMQLGPFAESIRHMSTLIDPKRCYPPDPAPMESICQQIGSIEPNSEGRIAAIEKEEQNRKAFQEQKRKEEEAERGTVVRGLKHGKAKRKEISRLLVNTNRERSPGGTDTALMLPCLLRNFRDEYDYDDSTSCEAENFIFSASEDNLQAAIAIDDHDRCSSTLSISMYSTASSSHSPPTFRSVPCEAEIAIERTRFMQSLEELFARQREKEREGTDTEEHNVLASAVKDAQKGRKSATSTPIPEPPAPVPRPRATSRRRRKRRSGEQKAETTPSTPVMSPAAIPVAPFVPDVLLLEASKKLGGFEAKELMLKSLKESFSAKSE